MAKKQDLFFQIFAGEYVSMVTTVKTRTVQLIDDEPAEVEMPVIIEGFLLDKDDSYYFIGESPDEVIAAIRIEHVIQVEISNPKDHYDQLLTEMQAKNKGSVN